MKHQGFLGIQRARTALCVALALGLTAAVTGCGGGSASQSPLPPQSTISISISPDTVAVLQVTGSVNRQVNWTVQEGAAGGVITTNGVYTAPLTQGVFHVIAASQADSTKSITAAVTVPAVSVAISPSMPIVNEDEAQAFTALVSGSINTAVVWSIQEGTAGGAITANGVYTAPSTQGTFHIVATSQADSAKNSTATVTVPPVSVVIAPQSDTLKALGTRTFTATTAAGTPIIAVTWSVQEGTPGGTVDNSGTYTAPSTLGTFHVIATSVPDPNQRAVATVTVVPSGFRAVGPMSSGVRGMWPRSCPAAKFWSRAAQMLPETPWPLRSFSIPSAGTSLSPGT